MLRFYTLFLLLAVASGTQAQTTFKQVPEARPSGLDVNQLQFRTDLITRSQQSSAQPLDLQRFRPLTIASVSGVRVLRDEENGQIYGLKGRPASLQPGPATKEDAFSYLEATGQLLGLTDVRRELIITEENTDDLGQTHLRLEQRFKELPVYPSDARLHATNNQGFDLFTGRLSIIPYDFEVTPVVSEEGARSQVRGKLSEQWVDLPANQLAWISGPQLEARLIVLAEAGKEPVLAWKIDARPNLVTHEVHLIDALTGATLSANSHLCGFRHLHSAIKEAGITAPHTFHSTSDRALLDPDGPYTTTQQNLYDQNETINTFSLQDTFILLDGSREMFTIQNGNINGYILTYDGLGGTPQLEGFSPGIPFSLNNQDWTKTGVSVHANAGASYQYFFSRFGRNSINGSGGNILSFMNVNETDGTEMDNAFWNGQALFYGNGSTAFSRLPRGLDVAGHEMAHGVIQATANLIYQLQPGALNESFADIFGYLVEGETGDYRIGEDVVRTNVFPSGAMRNLQNPNNGASGPSDFRWQPAHMDEFRTLPNTPDGDNGGVHINSGIPNRAFFLFSSHPAVGDNRAEQVYYRALNTYLTRSSRFIDLRMAVVQAAGEIFNDDVVAAANAAFDAVGIGSSGDTDPGPDPTADLETNPGDRFVLVTNDQGNVDLFIANEDGGSIEELATVTLGSRPSITDNGEFAIFIDDQNRIRLLNIASGALSFLENNPQTIWRNAVISKDGNRLALITTDNNNEILIFDLQSNSGLIMELFNPTTANGISTGDVQYSDALEWDPAGEFLMFDALSRLNTGTEYWDIGFLRAWNNATDDFGDGNVIKLTSSLPENISIGNPTFSKNSPYIIAFEEVDFNEGTFTLKGANIETGESSTIFVNGKVNYPDFGVGDDRICFDATSNGEPVLAFRQLGSDKISPVGNPFLLIQQGHWGRYFATGDRDLDTSIEGPIVEDDRIKVYPTVTDNLVTLEVPAGLATENIQVFDLQGRPVLSLAPVRGRAEIAIGSLPAATYTLVIPVPEGVVVRRVVVR